MSVDNKVLERIKKMITLGNDAGATEHERETALRMAYNILAKHNLTMSDLPDDDAGKEGRERLEITLCGDRWIRRLCQAVARLFFCKYYYCRTNTSGKETHYFIGLQSNVVTALEMSVFLTKSIRRESTVRYRSPTSPEGRSFGVGTTDSICRRVSVMLASDTESTPGTALVLVSMHKTEQLANDQWLEAAGTTLKVRDVRPETVRGSAYQQGREFGKTVSLNKQVGTGTENRRLK